MSDAGKPYSKTVDDGDLSCVGGVLDLGDGVVLAINIFGSNLRDHTDTIYTRRSGAIALRDALLEAFPVDD